MLTETAPVLGSAGPTAAPSAGNFSGAAHKSAGGRVLVIDDETLLRWSVAQTLGPLGYEVLEAESGAEGLRRLRESSPTAVLLDLQLPDCGDLRILREIRAVAPATPVVLMTAFVTPEIEAEAGAIGAARVLRKPFDLESLAPLVDILGRDGRPHDSRR